MKWLQDNPVGMVLASISGFFLLLVLVMTVVWNLPVSVDTPGAETGDADGSQASLAAHDVGAIEEFQVVNEKPVFNESRLPVTDEDVDENPVEDFKLIVKDAPNVKLTGVVITPNARLASLTPSDQKIEAVMAHEGESLTGDFVGWRLATVHPRGVVLESKDGQSLELELQVHDAKIEEPPKIETKSPINQSLTGQGEETGAEDEEPMSRAEQIRQRIAERREELRREQELQSQGEAQEDTASQPARPPNYQSAIRALINKKSKDQDSNDKEDG